MRGIFEVLLVATEPGDQVVVNPPVYAPFFETVTHARRQLVEVPLVRDADGVYELDLAALEQVFAGGARAYLLCSPTTRSAACEHRLVELPVECAYETRSALQSHDNCDGCSGSGPSHRSGRPTSHRCRRGGDFGCRRRALQIAVSAEVSEPRSILNRHEGLVMSVALNYRSLFEIPGGANGIVLARSHFRSWLQTKRDDSRSLIRSCDWDGPGIHDLGDGAHVTEVGLSEQDGSRLLRLTLEESNDFGRWVTDVSAAERPGRGSWSRFIWIETSNLADSASEAQSRDPMPPRLVRSLLGEVDGFNGAARLSARPTIARGDDADAVEALLAVLLDSERTVPVVVGAGFDQLPLGRWVDVLEQLTRYGIGLLSAVVLDPTAADELNDKLGQPHAVPIGGVRTFYPAVRPGNEADSYRHRYITPSTMLETVRRDVAGGITVRPALAHAVAWNARRSVLGAGLPSRVRRVDALLRREYAKLTVTASARPQLVERVTPAASAARTSPSAQVAIADRRAAVDGHATGLTEPGITSLLRLGEIVKQIFGTDELSDQHVVQFSQLVSALASDVPALEAEVAINEELLSTASADNEQLNSRLNEAELAVAISEIDLREIRRKALWYEKQLRDVQRYEALTVPAEAAVPEDLADLMERLGNKFHEGWHPLLEHVIFTGDRNVSEELLRYDMLGRIAGAAWDVLLTLGDYADAKQTEGSPPRNLYDYLQATPGGRQAVSLHRYSASESESVMQNPQWRAQRTFAVPLRVDPAGAIFMGAHFKLGGGDTISPRLYLHDAVDTDGNVYVGYIGRHLTNTLT